jgi:hypothetical protein
VEQELSYNGNEPSDTGSRHYPYCHSHLDREQPPVERQDYKLNVRNGHRVEYLRYPDTFQKVYDRQRVVKVRNMASEHRSHACIRNVSLLQQLFVAMRTYQPCSSKRSHWR